ncbi:hypothetical protein ACFVZ8_02630 [Streptomyces sp. NPDC059558]|uniref:hypothetical protein n=1 Tax=Streptomyces sp. NPDC059558 TaxID=3346864 RepID=UPI0036B32AA9
MSERHEAACRPQAHPRANPAGEERARASVEAALPQLLARWETECATVRIVLAAIAAAFPSADASQGLLPGLGGCRLDLQHVLAWRQGCD